MSKRTTLNSPPILLATTKTFHSFFQHPAKRKKKHRVLVTINTSTDFILHEKFSDPNKQYLILICNIAETKYTLACIYAPNSRQIYFLTKLMKKINKHRQESLIICCDFNIIPNESLDTSNLSIRHSSPMLNFLHTHNLHNVWR